MDWVLNPQKQPMKPPPTYSLNSEFHIMLRSLKGLSSWSDLIVYDDRTNKQLSIEINKESLKGLADFIYKYLENN